LATIVLASEPSGFAEQMWSPGALDLHAHALAPVAELPVLEILSATHVIADLTLGLGKVIYDYLPKSGEHHATKK
jgi:acetoacetate decarboxylase